MKVNDCEWDVISGRKIERLMPDNGQNWEIDLLDAKCQVHGSVLRKLVLYWCFFRLPDVVRTNLRRKNDFAKFKREREKDFRWKFGFSGNPIIQSISYTKVALQVDPKSEFCSDSNLQRLSYTKNVSITQSSLNFEPWSH